MVTKAKHINGLNVLRAMVTKAKHINGING